MKKTTVLLLVTFVASSVAATVDPDPDSIGIYFDGAEANVNCVMYTGAPVTASVVITSPTAEEIIGVEFGFHHDAGGFEGSMFIVPSGPLFGGVDEGSVNFDNTEGEVILPFTEPLIPDAGNVVVYFWDIVLFSDFVVNSYLGPSGVGDAMWPRYVVPGPEFVTVLPSTGGVDVPVSAINGGDICPVANETTSFGQVKSLFR